MKKSKTKKVSIEDAISIKWLNGIEYLVVRGRDPHDCDEEESTSYTNIKYPITNINGSCYDGNEYSNITQIADGIEINTTLHCSSTVLFEYLERYYATKAIDSLLKTKSEKKIPQLMRRGEN